jgi:hypothetical protein
MSFSVAVFMSGMALITGPAIVPRRYVTYTRAAAILMIVALNGVSIIETVVRP